MKNLIIIIFWSCVLSSVLSHEALAQPSAGYLPFLEEGKTWWYEVTDHRFNYETNEAYSSRILFGARITGYVEMDGAEWMECHLVDSVGGIVTRYPVAYLREKDQKVYVTADHLNLHSEWWRDETGCPIADSPYLGIITGFAGFSHDQEIWLGECLCDIDKDFPALLYDFGAAEGTRFSWPWYGSPSDLFISIEALREQGWPVTLNIVATGRLHKNGHELGYQDFYNQTWTESHPESTFFSGARIIEGVGVPYMENCWIEANGEITKMMAMDYGGLFFNPGQFFEDIITKLPWEGMTMPILLGVERPDGTLLYGDESRPWSGVRSVCDDEWPGDDGLYDLMGRRVERPVKGSIYIRQGKKVVFR